MIKIDFKMELHKVQVDVQGEQEKSIAWVDNIIFFINTYYTFIIPNSFCVFGVVDRASCNTR